ncbi:winged helix-turn-helix domain-containing protein [Thalassomonas haliotis]|uniref:Winged helix-turn-helix domain-containing protein n=1 Tax=Thalassomonas haliotis TaxID=485448 RepID=A0ABY7VKB3_9GAMM|nr:winged helix-turn-helix domain-containing protein [Thalassomonas haliotis]WDE14179.1 winged helix-turn-helix domain-containing protein [Thalassomonas haliotis]
MNNNKEFYQAGRSLQIGDARLDIDKSLLEIAGNSIKLEPLPLAFLCFLSEHQGQVVSRDQLLAEVWDNRVVSDDSIRKVVKRLREAFGDDAKAPRYIKTVPMKGYALVASVDKLQPLAASEASKAAKASKGRKYRLFAGALLCVLLPALGVGLGQLFFLQANKDQVSDKLAAKLPEITRLSQLSGSEVPGSYHPDSQTLVFAFRNNNSAPWQLYSRNIPTGEVNRLTWGPGHYEYPIFSPDGKKIAYLRLEPDEYVYKSVIADFDPVNGLSNIESFSEIQPNKEILSWSANGEALYLASNEANVFPKEIYRFDLKLQNLQQLTFPNLTGFGDYYAKESPDGKLLAVFRNVADRSFSMFIMDLEHKKLLAEKPLTFFPSALVWQQGSQQLAISSFKGDFYYYSLVDDRLTEQAGSHPGLNDVFYTCGERCFYMREHLMDYTDILEVPNPFVAGPAFSTRHLESVKADFNPLYNHGGDTWYYTSKDKEKGLLLRQSKGREPELLHRYNPRYVMTSLSLNKQENKLLGKLENRIFVLDLNSKELRFISSAMEIVNHPTWKRGGSGIYFMRYEKNQPGLFSYDLDTDMLTPLEQGIIRRVELADGRTFFVDDKEDLYQLFDDNSRRFIIRLPFVRANCWQLDGQYLYFSSRQGPDIHLNRLHLTSKTKETRVLAKSSSQQEFHLHPDGRRLLLTQSLLADSNLVKVIWPGPD